MIIQPKGEARGPGPLGVSPERIGGHIPRPLGLGPLVFAAGGATAKLVKTLTMPAPAGGASVSTAHEATSPLFSGTPEPADVRQGALATCPVGAILAALAHTASGRERLHGKHAIVVEQKSVVVSRPCGFPATLDATWIPREATHDEHDDGPGLHTLGLASELSISV